MRITYSMPDASVSTISRVADGFARAARNPRRMRSAAADRGSKRRLWNERSVAKAIEYVLYEQGDDLPEFDD